MTVFDEIRAEMSGTKADLAELRQEMRIGLERIEGRFARMDARFEASAAQMDTQIKQSDARFDAVLFT